MRSGLRDSGWAGSLFDEPIAPVIAETVRAKALRTLTNSDKRHPPYGLFWCEHERSGIELVQCGLCEVTPSNRPCKWAMNLLEHLKATHPVSIKPVLTNLQFSAAGPFPDEKGVATVKVSTPPAAELDVPDLVKVGDLVVTLHVRSFTYSIRKVTRVEKDLDGWQINGDLWDDFRHPRRKNVSNNEPIVDHHGATGWKTQDGRVVPLGAQKVVDACDESMWNETFPDERLITLTLEQVEQLCAIEETEDVNGRTWYTHVWLKPEGAKGHKNEQGYLEDPRKRWPCLGHARFVDTSAAAVAKIPSGRRSEVCEDEPDCEHCLCYTCQHQKDCRLDNTLKPCSACKTSGGAHHHKAVACEGYRNP
jgi:hypothetical protein